MAGGADFGMALAPATLDPLASGICAVRRRGCSPVFAWLVTRRHSVPELLSQQYSLQQFC